MNSPPPLEQLPSPGLMGSPPPTPGAAGSGGYSINGLLGIQGQHQGGQVQQPSGSITSPSDADMQLTLKRKREDGE